nr:YetF domain-containing protein [uncultured Massilia sp.]
MFDMDLPWWEFIVRGALVYLALLIMVRLSGRRTVSQLTPFDLLVVMLLSEAVSNGLSGGDDSLAGGLILAATLIVLNGSIGLLSANSRKMESLFEGEAVLIGRDGVFFDKVCKRNRVGQLDIEQSLRQADCARHEMQCSFLEPDGSITVLKRPPATDPPRT